MPVKANGVTTNGVKAPEPHRRTGMVRTPTVTACTGAGGGEGVRLKLQTPLFVADALLGAAGRQLETDLAAVSSGMGACKDGAEDCSEVEGVRRKGGAVGRWRVCGRGVVWGP